VDNAGLSVVSWNVNSLKVRLPLVLRFLDEHAPDVMCLQETKLPAALVDNVELSARGYHVRAGGTRGYAGVATLSKRPIAQTVHGFADATEHGDRRLLCQIDGIWIDNVYVPTRRAIGKSEFLDALSRDNAERFDAARDSIVLCGDFNICFDAHDLASLKMIAEVERFGQRPEDLALRHMLSFGLRDCLRKHHPDAKLFSWFPLTPWAIKRNYGMRLDYVFASTPMYERCSAVDHAMETRSWERPSDHLPVIARFRAAH
jgi:exodeoxyribonuclease-3